MMDYFVEWLTHKRALRLIPAKSITSSSHNPKHATQRKQDLSDVTCAVVITTTQLHHIY